MAGSWVVPGGGTGSANFTNTGLGWDGSNLLIGDFTNSRIVKASTDGAYVGQISLSGAPASSVQGVAYDTSDGSYWVCHYAATSGTIRRYNSSGTLQQTISPGLGTSGPNGCAYDAANDRILAAFGDNVIRSYNCTTGALVETITVSGHASGSGLDGITLDYTAPSTIIWGTFDGDSTGVIPAKPAYLYQINRSTGAATAGVVIPSSVEGVAFTSATDLYLCTDQFYHLGSANGNRVWKISKTTGEVQETTATQYASGSFTLNTSTSAQVIAGLGFSPRMVIFFGGLDTSGTTELNHFGVSDYQGRQWSMASRNKPAVATVVAERGWSSLYCYSATQGDGSGYGITASWGSVTHDGFALHVATAGGARRVHWIAIGGSGISAKVGSFDMTASTGNQAITGAGFMPSMVLLSANTDSTTEGFTSGSSRFSVGAMTASAQWCMSQYGVGGFTPSDEQAVARTDAAMVRIGNTLTTSMLAARSSLDADGFTINKSVAPGVSVRCGYAALAGADLQVALASFDQPASTGSQSITGIGFQPKAELFVSAGRAASTTVTAGSCAMIGAAMSASNRRVYWGGSADAVNPTQTGRAISEVAALLHATPGAGTPTTNALADFVSQDADGFTVNWTTADATARQNLVMAFGSPDAPADTTAPTLTGSITAVLVSTTSYTLTCPLATDDVAVTGYQYQINADGWVAISAGARSVTVTGRTPGATDSVQMRAFDAIPNYSTALSASVTLAADVVVPPVSTPPATGSLPIQLGLTSAGVLVIWA